jgi:hypothetical protein
MLGRLASNGGPTKTLLPGAGGPADDWIPKGSSLHGVTVCPGTDQSARASISAASPGPQKGETRCPIGAVKV